MKARKPTQVLDKVLVVEQKATIKNAFNESISVWDMVCRCQGAKIEGSGDEKETESGRLTSFSKVVFYVRFRSDITPSMRVLCDGAEYNILAVSEQGRRQWTLLECSRKD